MVVRAELRRGGPSPNSVVTVADLLARDAPWSGAPSAVAVAKRPASTSRTASPHNGGSPRTSRAVTPGAGDSRLRQFAAAAWGPQWRFVTIAAAVLLAGLMANGVMLVTFSGPSHSATAESDEGGYPTNEDPNAASRVYDDNGFPVDSALSPMFSAPGTGDLTAANTSGVGLPMTLTSLGTAVPTSSPTGTTVLRGTQTTSTPVRAVAPGTGGTGTGTGTGSASTTSRSSSGGAVGSVVRDTASGLGKTVEKTSSGLGKTLKKTTTGLTDTVGNVTDDLVGGGSSKSKSSNSSSGKSSSGSSNSGSKSGSNGGLLGGLLGK